jgi:hypothetical protein
MTRSSSSSSSSSLRKVPVSPFSHEIFRDPEVPRCVLHLRFGSGTRAAEQGRVN